jgi:hypothetical protein
MTVAVKRTPQGLTAAELMLHRSRSVSPGLLGAQRAAEAVAGAAGVERRRPASRAAGSFDSLATRGGSGGGGGMIQVRPSVMSSQSIPSGSHLTLTLPVVIQVQTGLRLTRALALT